jgi:hypothetical protein
VLIPAQVATFVSYLNLWKHVVDLKVGTALIVEDDVSFTDYAPQVASTIVDRGLLDQTGLWGDQPTLLRLGWAAGPEHRWSGRVELVRNYIQMSNPCHALNRAMASRLLEAFERVEMAVDGFTHRHVGSTVANFTLLPPLASELSWSSGAVDSLIHPKPIRAVYLRENHPERADLIEAAERAVREHASHIIYRPLLLVGHPRCGSGYMAQLLRSFGLDVGHGRMGSDGISSWMFAVEDEQNPYAAGPLAVSRRDKCFGQVIHFVRDPRSAIPSIVRENRHSQVSYAFRRKHILATFGIDLATGRTAIESALMSYIHWNKLIEAQPVDLRVRIEDAEETTFTFVKERLLVSANTKPGPPPPKDVNAEKLYKGALPHKPVFAEDDWSKVDNSIKDQLNGMCGRYGYPEVYNRYIQTMLPSLSMTNAYDMNRYGSAFSDQIFEQILGILDVINCSPTILVHSDVRSAQAK